jgi:autoinducer 2 (AI-2) kinase
VEGRQIAAVGITSQRQGTVLLDRSGREIFCSPNIDLRAVFEGAALDDTMGPEIYRATGHAPALLFAPARLRWFRQHQPDLASGASTLLSMAGWLGYRLTGQARGEMGLDCELGLVDVSSRRRSLPWLEDVGVTADLLPPIIEAGQPVGGLVPALARPWGLMPGTPVTLAGADTHCALLGLGMAEERQTAAIMGWSASVVALTSAPKLDADGSRPWVGCYPVDALYTSESNLGDAGNAYRWLVQTIGGGRLTYQEAEQLAGQIPPGSNGVSVFLGPGPTSAPQAGLRMGGIILPTPLSFQEASPGQIIRAYLESVAYSVKANLDSLAQVTGHTAPGLFLGGSMCRSDLLATMLADVLAVPIWRCRQPEVSALGAATAAWVLAGEFADLKEAVAGQCRNFDTFQPEPGRSAEYRDYYQAWRLMYQRLSTAG